MRTPHRRRVERLRLGFAATEREPEPSEVGPFPYQYRLTGQPERLAGRRVVVVDDVINAGSATLGTLSALRSANAVPVGIGALLVLEDAAAILASQTGIPLVTTATAQSSGWKPDREFHAPITAHPTDSPGRPSLQSRWFVLLRDEKAESDTPVTRSPERDRSRQKCRFSGDLWVHLRRRA